MTSQTIKELYLSPNGDRWTLGRTPAGTFAVCHQPNPSSGGRSSETELADFLSQGSSGPEYQALLHTLSDLGMHAGRQPPVASELTGESVDYLSRALGQAVARCWSQLSQEAQHDLFEAAVNSEGEKIRQQLAIFLHGKHDRTVDAVHAQATLEPDSLGG
jgi:hypothetical protein